jgi:hypothetical protein
LAWLVARLTPFATGVTGANLFAFGVGVFVGVTYIVEWLADPAHEKIGEGWTAAGCIPPGWFPAGQPSLFPPDGRRERDDPEPEPIRRKQDGEVYTVKEPWTLDEFKSRLTWEKTTVERDCRPGQRRFGMSKPVRVGAFVAAGLGGVLAVATLTGRRSDAPSAASASPVAAPQASPAQVARPRSASGVPNCDCTKIRAGLITRETKQQCDEREQRLLDLAAEGRLGLRLGPENRVAGGEFCDPTASGPDAWPVLNAPAVPPARIPRYTPCTPRGLVREC